MAEEETAEHPMEIVDPYETEDVAEEVPEATDPEPETPEDSGPAWSSQDEELLRASDIDVEALSSIQDKALVESIVKAVGQTHSEPESTEEPKSSFEIELNENFFDPDVVNQFKNMKSHYDAQIAELRNQLQSMNQVSESSKAFNMFDELNNPDIFGSGNVQPNSKEGRNRQKVLDEMDALKAGYEAKNRKVPSDETLLPKAMNLVFGEELASTVRKDFARKVEGRHDSRIARPNTRVSKPNNRVAEATRNVAAMMRDRGMSNNTETFD